MSSAEPIAGTAGRHAAAGLTSQDLHNLYYYMYLTRSLEDRVRSLYLQGKIQGAVYSSRGQEGTAVASALALGPDDVVAPLIRDLGASIVRGVEPRRILAQWLGRADGPSRGRDGNLHFGDLSKGVLAPISMLGATIPLCAGVALASVQTGHNRVALAYIGDGGSNTGDFHEGLNFAAVLRLPVVLMLEDNGFAYSTPVSRHVAIKSFADRASAYGIPSTTVDGNDVIEVYGATREAVSRARAGGGPTLIEAKTFRMRGHAEHDDAFYVPKELVEAWTVRDPINCLLSYLEEWGLMSGEDKRTIDDRVSAQIDDALEWAETSPLPDPVTQVTGVFAD